MEVAAIAVSLMGLGLAVTMALRDERRSRAEMAQCLAHTRKQCRTDALRPPGRGRH